MFIDYELLLKLFEKLFKLQVVVPRGPRLLPSAQFTLYVCLVINRGLGSSLSKHVFGIQETVAPVSNEDTICLLLILTGKLAAYLLSLSLTPIILCSQDSHSESEAESAVLFELSTSVLSGMSSVSVVMCLVI